MSSMVLINWLKGTGLPPLAAALIRVMGKSMRLFTVGESAVDDLYRQGQRIIIAFWHGRQVMMPLAYRGRGATILISQHRDGDFVARIMRSFGFDAVRGSTTRGGVPAIRQLLDAAKNGQDLVVTPDGPKGPARKIQLGVLYLAKVTGLPIVPLTFACSKKKSFPVGINLRFPVREAGGFLSGGSLYGWGGMRLGNLS